MYNLLENINALLITNPVNIYYLTGFMGLAPHERESYALITPTKKFLLVNPLYAEQAQQNAAISKVTICTFSRDNPLLKQLNEIIRSLELPTQSRIGFEETNVTHAEYEYFGKELKNCSLISTQNRVEQLRMIKRPDEIESLRKAAQLTDDCFTFVSQHVSEGMSESEMAWGIETFFYNHRAQSAFPPIVAFNTHSSQPHYHTYENQNVTHENLNENKLHPQSVILMDFGAKVNGYCADMTRIVFFGKPTPEQEKTYADLLESQQTAIDLLQKGERSGAKLDQAVRDVLAKHNLPPYPHSLGHSVGLDIHEAPRLSVRRDEELKPGMVFTIEPGVYLEGKFGIRIEDLVWINEKNEVEVLSKSNKKLTMI